MQNVNAEPHTAQSHAARLGHPLNKVTLTLYLVLLIWPSVFVYLNPYGGFGSDTLWGTMSLIDKGGQAVLALVIGVVAAMAAMRSNSSELRRRIGERLGFSFAGVGFIACLLALIPGISRMPFASLLIPLLFFVLSVVLFLSWAVARPFRGLGYLGILAGIIGIVLVWMFHLLLIPLMFEVPILMSVFGIIFAVIPTILAVVAAILLDKINTTPAAPMTTTTTTAPVAPPV